MTKEMSKEIITGEDLNSYAMENLTKAELPLLRWFKWLDC